MTRSSAKASVAEVEALASNFDQFIQATEKLRLAYEKLRERAEKIDLELARTNEALREKVEELDQLTGHLHGILAATPNGVIVTDPDGRITSVNRAAESILNIRSNLVIGKLARELRDRRGNPLLLHREDSQKTLSSETARTVDLGRKTVLGGAVSPIMHGDGRIAGYVEVVEDLSELWDLREQIHRLDKLAALGEMSAVIAHEIRNPLNAVHGFADLLTKKLPDDDSKTSGYARNIVRGVREVDEIITDLLAFASPEKLASEWVDLAALIQNAFDSIARGPGPQAGTAVQLEMRIPDLTWRIPGDALKLTQIFRNLFSNAADAMPNGGKVVVSAAKEGNFFRIDVQDEGAGIPAESREKVFDPFFTTKTQGTGLGLAIIRKLTELHGGNISLVDSKKGTCFSLLLPAENRGR